MMMESSVKKFNLGHHIDTTNFFFYNNLMKKILAILILNLCFIIPSQAGDVRDFQIEGISIGDELKNHFSNNVLSKVKKYEFKSPKYIAYEIKKSDVKSGTINFYDNIIIAVNNSNIIESIGGMIFSKQNKGL